MDNFRFELFRCLRRIAREFEVLPSSLYVWGLTKEGDSPKWGGGYAVCKPSSLTLQQYMIIQIFLQDIWKGQTASGDPVCLKVLRVFSTETSRKQSFKVSFTPTSMEYAQ